MTSTFAAATSCANACPSGCFVTDDGNAYFNPLDTINGFNPVRAGRPICAAITTRAPTAVPTRQPATQRATVQPTSVGYTYPPPTPAPTKKWSLQANRYCPKRFTDHYRTFAEAEQACHLRHTCSGVYHRACVHGATTKTHLADEKHRNGETFELCIAGPIFQSDVKSCVHEKPHERTAFGYTRLASCVDEYGKAFIGYADSKVGAETLSLEACRRKCDVQHNCVGIRFSLKESMCAMLVGGRAPTLTLSGEFASWKKTGLTLSSDPKCRKRVSTTMMPESTHGVGSLLDELGNSIL